MNQIDRSKSRNNIQQFLFENFSLNCTLLWTTDDYTAFSTLKFNVFSLCTHTDEKQNVVLRLRENTEFSMLLKLLRFMLACFVPQRSMMIVPTFFFFTRKTRKNARKGIYRREHLFWLCWFIHIISDFTTSHKRSCSVYHNYKLRN